MPLNFISYTELPGISDHYQINFALPLFAKSTPRNSITISSRSYKNIDINSLNNDIIRFLTSHSEPPDSPNQLHSRISSALTHAIDNHAPLKTKTFTPRDNYGQTWFTPDCRHAKRSLRSKERIYRNNRTPEIFKIYKLEQKLTARFLNLLEFLTTINSLRSTNPTLKFCTDLWTNFAQAPLIKLLILHLPQMISQNISIIK